MDDKALSPLAALAVYERRKPGDLRLAELSAGQPQVLAEDGETEITPATPGLVVQFEVPDALKLAECEAAAQEAMTAIRLQPSFMERYGFGGKALTDLQMLALAKLIAAVESAKILFKDWNFAEPGADGAAPVKRPLDYASLSDLMSDPNIRAAWSIHLDAASPLRRAEGNVFAASPTTTSAGAADTAPAA